LSATPTYRFGVFLFDAARLELTREGRPVHLQPQPAQVLATLLERAGRPVSRDDLRRAVWPGDTFVDFDRGLNFCVAQIRTALGDDAATPRYVRTLPKKGYEFICPVEASGKGVRLKSDPFRGIALAVGLVLLAAIVVAVYVAATARANLPIVAVARFDNETGDPALSRFSDALTDTLVERLTTQGSGRYAVVGNAAILRLPRDRRDLRTIASSLHAQYVVIGQLQRDDRRLRVLAHLIRLPEQTHITVSRTDGIAVETLAATDDIAARIAAAFDARLRQGGATSSSRAAASP